MCWVVVSVLIEQVTGYDGDGRAVEALFLDGVQVRPTACYELDPDHRLLRRGRTTDWLQRQHTIAAGASPAAGELIRRWADQTAEYGGVDDLDDEYDDGDVIDGQVLAVEHREPPAGQP